MKNTDIFRELGGLDPDLVMKAAPPETPRATAPKKSFAFYKRLIACAASFALVIGLFSLIGFDTVYASIQNIFSFIPGIGIEAAGNTVYVYEPVGDSIEHGGKRAELLVASFKDGELTVIMSSSGLPLMGEDVRLTRNGDELAVAKALPFVSSESGIIELAYETEPPERSDVFDITVAGFDRKLSFCMTPCTDYAELAQIGPTAEHNGISVTVTAKRAGDKLIVWYYDTKGSGATRDEILAVGQPAFGSNTERRCIKTAGGIILEDSEDWAIANRSVYTVGEGEAELYIPYLSLRREEKAKFKLRIPEGYGTHALDAAAETSLGEIKIIGVERTEHEDGRDRLMLRLDYADSAENTEISSFGYTVKGYADTAVRFNAEEGRAEYLEILVDRGEDELTVSLDSILYYLTDDYVLGLGVK